MTALTLEGIEALLAQTRTRGEYKPVIEKFVASGELAFNLSERFPGKVAASLKNAVQLNINKTENPTDLKLVTLGDKGSEQVVLINMQVYATQQAEATANEA